MMQQALKVVNIFSIKDQLLVLHQLETYISQVLEYVKPAAGKPPDAKDLGVKQLICKDVPPILVHLLLSS